MIYDPVFLIETLNSSAVFIKQMTFTKTFLLDSIGPVSLHHVIGWWEFPQFFGLQAGSLGT